MKPVLALLVALAAAQGGSGRDDARIVPAYRGMEAFGRARIAAPADDAGTLYRRLAVDPYAADCSLATGPFQVLDASASPYEAVVAAQQIDAASVVGTAASALARVEAVLPLRAPLRLCVHIAKLDGATYHLEGVGGVSLGGGRISLFLYPTVHRFARVPYVVAHEYHHEVLREATGTGWGPSPLDAMIAEGKADHFAVRQYPALRPKHTARLSDEELARVWPVFVRMRSGDLPAFRRDFMIAAQSSLPLWSGYRLGFEMAESCLGPRPEVPASWLNASAESCLQAFLATPRGRRVAR